jgi:cellulose synthase operon protein C
MPKSLSRAVRPGWRRFLLPGLMAVALAAQAGPLEDAKTAWDTGDLRRATIVLKDRLQQDPNDAAARVLLAQVYLDSGQATAAEQEIERARKLAGVDTTATLVPMARALLGQGKGSSLLDEPEPGEEVADPATRAALLALRGEAYLAADDTEAAGLAYGKALALEPKQPIALRGKVKMAQRSGLAEHTAQMLAEALKANPDDPETLILAGDFAFMQGRHGDAEAKYTQALGRAHNAWLVYYKRGLARIELGRLAEAGADLKESEARLAEFPGLHYGRGLLAFRQGNYEAAQNELETYLKVFPDDRDATYYAAAALYKLKRNAQAEEYLVRLLSAAPDLTPAANLLAAIRLENGNPRGAEEALAPFVQAKQPSAETLRLHAKALAALGRSAEAQAALGHAKIAAPEDNSTRIALAAAHLSEGKPDLARREVQPMVAAAPDSAPANTLLVKSFLDQGDSAAALRAAQAFVSAAPSSAQARYVLGVAENTARDEPAARAAFAKAMELEAGHPDSAFALATLELKAGRPDGARALYEQVLAAHPEHTEAILKLTQLDVTAGNKPAALERLRSALATDPGSLELRVNLARGLLSAGQTQEAARVLQDAPGAVAEDPRLLLLRASMDLESNQPFNAISTLETLVAKQPASADGHFLLASAFAATKNATGMQEQLLAGYKIDPKSTLAGPTLERVYAALSDSASKRALLSELKGRGGDASVLALLDARLSLDDGQFKKGLEQLAALQRAAPKDRGVLLELLGVQVKGGELFGATQTANAWIKENPQDFQVRRMLAQIYIKRGRSDQAVQAYQALVAEQPDDAVAQNNLATLLLEKDPAGALSHARAASQAAPKDPAIADTLGQALLAAGDPKGAVAALAQAHGSLPGEPSVALHYASALAASGDPAKARAVLLPMMDKSFPEKPQAQALLKTLAGQ